MDCELPHGSSSSTGQWISSWSLKAACTTDTSLLRRLDPENESFFILDVLLLGVNQYGCTVCPGAEPVNFRLLQYHPALGTICPCQYTGHNWVCSLWAAPPLFSPLPRGSVVGLACRLTREAILAGGGGARQAQWVAQDPWWSKDQP